MTVTRPRGMTDQAAQTAIDQACRLLRLPTIRRQFGDLTAAATRDQMTYTANLWVPAPLVDDRRHHLLRASGGVGEFEHHLVCR
ncbi:hypothetical protein FRAHR75_1840003 [Frankia sp. Hr75.2]|nr:hypothetical protein FRAHR75_1840003 [Frankia sp. Hr75.2]